VVRPSEVTQFVAEIGIVFLLFFLGLDFTIGRLARSRRHAFAGGAIDFVVNMGVRLIVGIAAFGFSFGAIILAAAIYVSSSAITVSSSCSGSRSTSAGSAASPGCLPRRWRSASSARSAAAISPAGSAASARGRA
jgi:Kef-type K+ transport system membrane component KefB